MLTIRPAQMEVFIKNLRRHFHKRVLAYLRRSQTSFTAGKSEESLLKWIATRHEEAEGYSLVTESAVVRYIDCALMSKGGLATDDEAQAILQRDLPPDFKVEELWAHVAAQPAQL